MATKKLKKTEKPVENHLPQALPPVPAPTPAPTLRRKTSTSTATPALTRKSDADGVAKKIARLQNKWKQGDLFERPKKLIKIGLEIEEGTPVTFGSPTAALSPIELFKALEKLSTQEIYQGVKGASLKASTITNLLKTLHGEIYHLAHIGGKKTKR